MFHDDVEVLQIGRSPQKLVKILGLSDHQSLAGVKHPWDKIFRKVVYHSDPHSLYRSRAPTISTYDPGEPPPPAPPPPPDPPQRRRNKKVAPIANDGPPAEAASSAAVEAISMDVGDVVPASVSSSSGVVYTTSSFYEAAKMCEIVKFTHDRLAASFSAPGRRIFSCKMAVAAINQLVDLLSQTSTPDASGPTDISRLWEVYDSLGKCSKPGETGDETRTLFFSVVSASPSLSKRSVRGRLAGDDVGIQLHKCVAYTSAAASADASITVSCTPVTVDAVLRDEMDMKATALVLSPRALSKAQLERLREWSCSDELTWALERSVADKEALKEHMGLLPDVLFCLVSASQTGYTPHAHLHDAEPRVALLDVMVDLKIAISNASSDHSLKYWTLTPEGEKMVLAGITCCKSALLLKTRDLPLKELSKFELVMRLEAAGWTCKIAWASEAVKKAKSEPYDRDVVPKVQVWWLDGRIEPASCHFDRPYMMCLLSADTHKKPVPHFMDSSVYELIMDSQWVRKPRKLPRVSCIPLGDWDMPGERPPKKQRTEGQNLKKIKFQYIDSEEDESSVSPISSSSEDNSSKASSPKPVPSSSSSSSSSSSDSHGATAKAKVAPGFSAAKAKAKAKVAANPSVGARSKDVKRPCGVNFLTPRCASGGGGQEIKGWQITCLNPLHQDPKCTKEVSNAVSGSDDASQRMLRAWAIWGVCELSKTAHRLIWPLVQAQYIEGLIPSLEELTAMDITDWGCACAPTSMIVAGAGNDLGEAAPGVLAAVHAEMQELVRTGVIQPSTLIMRTRQKHSKGCEYGVPPGLHSAWLHGYISPNLPPPQGLLWKFKGNKWFLAPRGG